MKQNKSDIVLCLVWWCCLTALISVLLSSCSPVKRLERLHRNHPYLFDKANDTLRIKDTVNVIIPGTEVDTFFTIQNLTDTVYFQKDALSVKAYIYRDTLYLTAKQDTIYKTVTRDIKVPYKKLPRDGLIRYLPYFIILILLACIWLMFYFFKRRKLDSVKSFEDW